MLQRGMRFHESLEGVVPRLHALVLPGALYEDGLLLNLAIK